MGEQPSNGAPLWPGPMDAAARLGRLEQRLAELEQLRPAVESALVAQAARIEAVLSRVRGDLAEAARSHVTAAREATGEAAAVGERVQAALARVAADGDDLLAEVQAAMRTTAGPVEALTGAVEALHVVVTELQAQAAQDRRAVQQLADRVGELATSVEEGLAAVTDALAQQGEAAAGDRASLRDQQEAQAERLQVRLRDTAAAAVEEVRHAADRTAGEVTERLADVGARLQQTVAAVSAVEDTVTDHLSELDRRAALERARLTQAFVEQLAEASSRRERRRLAKRLEVPEPAPDRPAEPAPAEPAPAARASGGASPDPVDDAERRLIADDVPSWESTKVGTEVVDDDATPPPARSRARPSRRARPVRRTASDPQDPAAVRRALAAVRGLGPARQSALIDRFGSLEAIRAASDDDLLSVAGIGPALLPGIRDAVG